MNLEHLPKSADLVVIGAGIMGAVTALRAAEAGADVVVIEKEWGPAGEQSGRAQGALRAMGKHGPAIKLTEESLKIWRGIANEADAEIVFKGSLSVARTESDLAPMVGLISEFEKLGMDRPVQFDELQTRTFIPALKGPLVGSVLREGDGHCNPRKSTNYFARQAENAGAKFYFGTKAVRLLERGGSIAGVETTSGTILAGRVVVACGVWTQFLARTVGIKIPIMPVVLSGCETTPVPPLFQQSLRTYGYSGHQRSNGRIVVSAGVNAMIRHEISLTTFDSLGIWLPRLFAHRKKVRLRVDRQRIARQLEFRDRWSTHQIQEETAPKAVDRPLMRGALSYLQDLIPELKSAQIARYWAGYLDMSPDAIPIVDSESCPDGMVVATGMSGHGLVLGPVMGAILSQMVLENRSPYPVHEFRLARFKEGKVPIPANTI
ncbi:MAG: NAD(P)/FAD-dependent oxidoreductase [Pseudobdellovibrionaceae bacterium]